MPTADDPCHCCKDLAIKVHRAQSTVSGCVAPGTYVCLHNTGDDHVNRRKDRRVQFKMFACVNIRVVLFGQR